jgi:hypothetical protein
MFCDRDCERFDRLTELLVGKDVDGIFHRVRSYDRTIIALCVRTLKGAFQQNENFELFE